MKATSVMIGLVAMATAGVAAAQPVDLVAVHASAQAMEPVWMMLSGATLLGFASALRRYIS